MDVECEESYRNHKESLQLFLEFNLPTCVAWCVLKHWICPISPTDPRQDDVCTELRHRAEQADLEAQLGNVGDARDIRQIQLMRLTHLTHFYPYFTYASRQARATRERKPWSQIVFEE